MARRRQALFMRTGYEDFSGIGDDLITATLGAGASLGSWLFDTPTAPSKRTVPSPIRTSVVGTQGVADREEDALAMAFADAPLSLSDRPTYREGNSGPDVATIEKRLQVALGETLWRSRSRVTVGSSYDRDTVRSVKQFQSRTGLPVTGMVDGATWKALNDRAWKATRDSRLALSPSAGPVRTSNVAKPTDSVNLTDLNAQGATGAFSIVSGAVLDGALGAFGLDKVWGWAWGGTTTGKKAEAEANNVIKQTKVQARPQIVHKTTPVKGGESPNAPAATKYQATAKGSAQFTPGTPGGVPRSRGPAGGRPSADTPSKAPFAIGGAAGLILLVILVMMFKKKKR